MMQSFGLDKGMYDNEAHTFGLTYYSSYLQLYTMHPTGPGDTYGKPEYHTTQIDTYGLNVNAATCQQCIGA